MKRKFRILFLGEPTSANTLSWIEGLREAGCDVKMASARSSGDEEIFPIGPVHFAPRARMLAGIEDLQRIIKKTSPDILIAYRITSYGYIAAKTSFKPLVLAAQNEQIVWSPEKSMLRKMMLSHFAKFAIKNADMIHAWGNNIKDGLMRFGADERKILVMHRGIDTETYRLPEHRRIQNPANPIFISTRSLEKEYLIDRLLRAFSILLGKTPGAELKIAGEGPERKNLEELADALKIKEQISFLGKLNKTEIAEELKNSDFYVSPIGTEGISSSLIESCACGIVPIVADISASRELVENGKNAILLKDDSVEELSDAMLGAPAKKEISKNALINADIVRSRYDRKKNLGIFVSHYRRLAGAPPEGDIKIHICHVTTSHAPDDNRIFQRQCRSLAQKGYKVSLIARVKKKTAPYEQDGVNIIPVRYILGKPGRKIILPKIAVEKARRLKADIYHFHDPELMPWMCIMAKNYPVKIIWDAHELYSATIKEFYVKKCSPLSKLLTVAYSRLEKMWCANFAGIVAVTDDIRKIYADMGCTNCVTVRNTVDMQKIPRAETCRNSFFSIIASGTTNSSRCIIELIDAFKIAQEKHAEIILNLVAHFESPEEEKLIRRHITGLGLDNNVQISQPIPWEQLMSMEIPRNHLGMVLYAKTENNCAGLPNRLFEYWALGLPVVATDTKILRSIVGDANAGKLVDSDNPGKIAGAILDYVENPALLAEHGRNAQKAVREKYNWNNDLAVLSAFYDKIVADCIR